MVAEPVILLYTAEELMAEGMLRFDLKIKRIFLAEPQETSELRGMHASKQLLPVEANDHALDAHQAGQITSTKLCRVV